MRLGSNAERRKRHRRKKNNHPRTATMNRVKAMTKMAMMTMTEVISPWQLIACYFIHTPVVYMVARTHGLTKIQHDGQEKQTMLTKYCLVMAFMVSWGLAGGIRNSNVRVCVCACVCVCVRVCVNKPPLPCPALYSFYFPQQNYVGIFLTKAGRSGYNYLLV